MDSKELLQAYSNACADLGNTQALIEMLKRSVESFNRDLEKLQEKSKVEVEKCMALRRDIDKRGSHES